MKVVQRILLIFVSAISFATAGVVAQTGEADNPQDSAGGAEDSVGGTPGSIGTGGDASTGTAGQGPAAGTSGNGNGNGAPDTTSDSTAPTDGKTPDATAPAPTNGATSEPAANMNGATPEAGASFEQFEKHMTVLRFTEGGAEVTMTHRDALREAFSGMSDQSKNQEFMLIAWSDQPFPTGEKSLPEADKKLAESRADNVEAALKELGISNVETYNMSERPSWISQVFSTYETKIKESYKDAEPGAGAPEDLYDRVAGVLKSKGGPSTVVVGPMPKAEK